jgi:O-antigen/teichoic acid export membrane protein
MTAHDGNWRLGPHPLAASPVSSGGATNFLARRSAAEGGKGKPHVYSLLLKDSVIYGGGRALQKLLAALMLPLFTAFLSADDYGVIGMVVAFTTLLDVFVTLGFDVAFSRFFFDSDEPSSRSKVITHTFYVDFFFPGILLGVVMAFMPQISRLIMGADGYTTYFLIGTATLFFTNLSDLPFQLMRLEHRPWTFTAFTAARVGLQLPMAVILLAVFDMGTTGYLLANLVTAVIINIAALPFYVTRLRFVLDLQLTRSMFAFAIPAMFTAISFYFLKLSDRFFLLHYKGQAEVGLYTVANSLAQPLYVAGMAFRMAWPQWHYARLSDPALHKRLVARSSTYFMTLNGFLIVAAAVFLPLVIHVLLNSKFWSVGPTTFVLTLSISVNNLYFIFWVGANVAKKNRLIPFIALVASAVNIGLNFLVVPIWGMYGAAWTTVLGFAILAVLVFFVSRHWYPIPYEWGRLLKTLLATVLGCGAAFGIGALVGLSPSLSLGRLVASTALAALALVLFGIILWVTRFFTPSERRRMAAAAHIRRRGEPAPPALGAPAQSEDAGESERKSLEAEADKDADERDATDR